MPSSIYLVDFVVPTGVDSFTNLVGGSGYTIIPTVTIAPPDNEGGIQATATATIDSGAVDSVTISTNGSGYITVPVVTIAPPDTAGDTATVDAVLETPIALGTNIFSTPITITSDQVSPGGGGVLLLYFSFTMGSSATVSVTDGEGTTLKGNLNADNNSLVDSNGLYRFDIDVKAGDTINLRSTVDITVVNHLRVHLIQKIGA